MAKVILKWIPVILLLFAFGVYMTMFPMGTEVRPVPQYSALDYLVQTGDCAAFLFVSTIAGGIGALLIVGSSVRRTGEGIAEQIADGELAGWVGGAGWQDGYRLTWERAQGYDRAIIEANPLNRHLFQGA